MSSDFLYKPTAKLRGNRDYIHSTDIYQQILDGASSNGLQAGGGMDLRIKRKMTTRVVYRYSNTASAESDLAGVVASIEINNEPWVVELRETGDPADGVKAYDEARICDASRLGDVDVLLDYDVGMQPIEVVTALAVHLHKRRFSPPQGLRWLLARLELKRLLRSEDASQMKISIDRRIGDKITRSRILAADGDIGAMTFMLG